MAKRIQVRLIMQLHADGMSQDDIAISRHMSKSSISKVLAVAREKNITYADIKDKDDTAVYKMFFPDHLLTEEFWVMQARGLSLDISPVCSPRLILGHIPARLKFGH